MDGADVTLVSRQGQCFTAHTTLLRARCSRTKTLASLWVDRVSVSGANARLEDDGRLRICVDVETDALRVAIGYVVTFCCGAEHGWV